MESATPPPPGMRFELLYHFCRLQMPGVTLTPTTCSRHLQRTYSLHRKTQAEASWDGYLDNLYPLDWYLACCCLEGNSRAWEQLFAARAGRSDCLLVDGLRARAARFFPRNEERQDSEVTEFWSLLYVPAKEGGLPILGRYDGARPLVPWLLRVFHNWIVSKLRPSHVEKDLTPEEWDRQPPPLPPRAAEEMRWHEAFCQAAREWLTQLPETELLILGLRLRYHLSQREVATALNLHEGNVSRRTDKLRDECHAVLNQRLGEQGWSGDDLFALIRTEMPSLLLDDPRLSADHLAHLLNTRRKGKGAAEEDRTV